MVLPASVLVPALGKSSLSALLLGGGACEQPRLRLLERVDVAAVVGEDGTRRLHVAHASELKLEVDPARLALGLELRDLAAQLLGRLCVLGGLGNLRLERRDLLVSLGDGLLPVGAAHLRLVLRRLLALAVLRGLRLFLRFCAMCITCHAGLPSSLADSSRQPAPVSYGYRLSARHKVTGPYSLE